MENLKYPIGRYRMKEPVKPGDISRWIADMEKLPERLRAAVQNMEMEQLDTPYRDGGWTVRQVVHHITDSHLNGYLRFKLALTEDRPTIKPYDQESWSKLPDYQQPVEDSLNLLESLHNHWVYLLKSLDDNQLDRKLVNPESGEQSIKNLIGLYAWHGNHHLGHITTLIKRKNWN